MADTPRPLRILHLTAGSDAGGVSRYLLNLAAAMHERGHEVVVAGERGAWHSSFEKQGVEWIDLPLKGSWLKLRQAAGQLAGVAYQRKFDVLHTHYRRCGLVARRVQRLLNSPSGGGGANATVKGPPILFTLHLTGLPLGWRRLFTDPGDHAHVASAQARRWIQQNLRLPDERVTLIPHGIDPRKFPVATEADRAAARRMFGLSDDAVVAAFVGRLDSPKNEEWLLDLAERSRDTLPTLRILVAGEGPHDSAFRRRIERDRLSGRVTALGHQDPLPVYQAADAVLLPSALEGFSFVTTEAMSVGRPVLRTRTAGTSEHIVENVTGRSVDIDRRAFLNAAVLFLSDRAALHRMGHAAAKHVRAHLTFDRQLDATLALYRRLAGM